MPATRLFRSRVTSGFNEPIDLLSTFPRASVIVVPTADVTPPNTLTIEAMSASFLSMFLSSLAMSRPVGNRNMLATSRARPSSMPIRITTDPASTAAGPVNLKVA